MVQEEAASGPEFLGHLIDAIAGGKMPSTALLQQVHGFLHNLQAKVDLTQVGMVKFYMDRAKKLSNLIEVIENAIIPPGTNIVALSSEERLELLKLWTKELSVAVEFITSRANKPTISSPEGMKNATGEDLNAKKSFASQLSPEQRQRIRSMSLVFKARLTEGNAPSKN